MLTGGVGSGASTEEVPPGEGLSHWRKDAQNGAEEASWRFPPGNREGHGAVGGHPGHCVLAEMEPWVALHGDKPAA